MSANSKKAILLVSFGTSFHETREKTIDKIQEIVTNTYTDYKIYTAWTSKIIIKILRERDNIHENTVTEAMEQITADGIEELLVQPTHIINGIENEIMTNDILAFEDKLKKIVFSAPLLTTTEDNSKVAKAIMTRHNDLDDNEALILMGHGTSHYVNVVYAAMDYMFKDLGYSNVFLGTVEGYPSVESVVKFAKASGATKVRIIPFMLVAGDHANNDLAGDDKDSWKSIFERSGFEVECSLIGLGEYKDIREIYLEHLASIR